MFLFFIQTQRACVREGFRCDCATWNRVSEDRNRYVTFTVLTSKSRTRNTPINFNQFLNWLVFYTRLIFSLVLYIQITDKLNYLNRLLWKSHESSLAKISFAAEIVLRTQREQSTQGTSKLHVSKFFAIARTYCPICCGEQQPLVRQVSVCLRGILPCARCMVKAEGSLVHYSFYVKAEIKHNFSVSQNFTFHYP